jgi:hypothetical protein
MLSKLTFLTIILLSQNTMQACLDKEVLKKLGFTTPLDALKKITSAGVCKTLFAEVGTCVDEADVKKMLEADAEKA